MEKGERENFDKGEKENEGLRGERYRLRQRGNNMQWPRTSCKERRKKERASEERREHAMARDNLQ